MTPYFLEDVQGEKGTLLKKLREMNKNILTIY